MALSTIKAPKASGGVLRVIMPPICTAYSRIPPVSTLATATLATSGSLLGVFLAPSAGLGFPAIPMSVADVGGSGGSDECGRRDLFITLLQGF